VQQEDEAEVDRHPGHVVERREVAQRLHPVGPAAQRALDRPHEALGRHPLLHPGRHALHQLPAHRLEQGEDQGGHHGDQREIVQGVEDPAGQNPVEHLHHVQRGGQLQQVHHPAEQAHHDELLAASPQRPPQRRLRPGLERHRGRHTT
jgi:hypothetical protein